MAGDNLTVIGGTFATGTFAFTGKGAGTAVLTGHSTISYTGIESIAATGTKINNVIFNFNSTDKTM